MFYLLLPRAAQEQARPDQAPEAAAAEERVAAPVAAAQQPVQPVASVQLEQPPQRVEKNAATVTALPYGEPFTRMRVVNDQVLVLVTVRHGGATVRLELVLDTGATRTALHESVASRVPIDLRSARAALAELADGRSAPR